MAVNKIFVFTIVSFVGLGQIQIGTSYPFTTEKLLGTWYTDAMINPIFNSSVTFSCSRTYITREIDRTSGNVHAEVIINGQYSEFEGDGTVVDSELHIVYPALGMRGSVFHITTFRNDKDLILQDKENAEYYLLLSREIDPSAEAQAEFERRAAVIGVNVTYVDQRFCSETRIY